MKAVVHTDGGARGNPGPAAIGIVIRIERREPLHISEAIGDATNNVAEYRALIRGLQEAKSLGVMELECRLDSELVVKQLNREYKVREQSLSHLFVQVWNLAQGFRSIRFVAVPRSENREADRLVNKALAKAGHPKRSAFGKPRISTSS
ncbi:MAG: ribonuclease HI family protein [bacterium]|nr:ribonuclease HI family protein [bacterium]